MKIKLIIVITCLLPQFLNASKISRAYQALSVFNYFEAKKLFYASIKTNPTQASYGLSVIFNRIDNPFSDIDSAAKYISIALKNTNDSALFSTFIINKESIKTLSETIALKGYIKYCKNKLAASSNHFLAHFYFAKDSLMQCAFLVRDDCLYQKLLVYKSSDSVKLFMLNHPESSLMTEAKKLYDDFEYYEQTSTVNINSLQLFIKNFPKNSHIHSAEIKLFSLITDLRNKDSLYHFIIRYSTSITQEEAWKFFYSLTVTNYSKENLQNFVIEYPQYPFREAIEKELRATENLLIPFKNKDEKMGYIDTLGNWIIAPKFDEASDFSEGLASVCNNDTCYFINKQGERMFTSFFDEAETFKNGITIVKRNNAYCLMNRIGQIISKSYQEINSQSEKLFVCKDKEKYGAINDKGDVVIPFLYNKLGDFKNGFAYYFTSYFGLLNKNNQQLDAQWDWVSGVDTNHTIIVSKDKKFGLINSNEQMVLVPQFDYVAACKNGIYLIVKDSKYGFFDVFDQCFLTEIDFTYNAMYDVNYYTNGKYFKLLRNNDISLIDANGRSSIPFGMYTNLFFAKCDLIRIQKNSKYGFVDRKLKLVTPIEYIQATDFENNLAIVKTSKASQIITTQGKLVYEIQNGTISKVNSFLYKVWVEDNKIGVINDKGETLLKQEFSEIESITSYLFRCRKKDDNELYLFNGISKKIKKM
jgi:hypothetical protein